MVVVQQLIFTVFVELRIRELLVQFGQKRFILVSRVQTIAVDICSVCEMLAVLV